MTPRHIRIIGVIVLIAGLGSAAAIYFTAQPADRQAILGVDIRTNRQRSQIERLGGRSSVMFSDLNAWLASLWHGPRLGGTVGVLSVLGFLVCRGLARVHEDSRNDLSRAATPSDPAPPKAAASPRNT